MRHSNITSSLAIACALLFAAGSAQAEPGFKYDEKSVKGAYSFYLGGSVSFAPFNATESGLATAPRQDILRIGVFIADGKGALKGHMVATTDTNAGATEVRDFTFTGTYTVETDGLGTFQITPDGTVADEGAESYAIVVNARTKNIRLIQTDNEGGGAKVFLSGEASQNRPIK